MLGLLQFDQLMHAVADGQGVVLGRSQSLTRVFREGKLVAQAQAQAHRA